MARTTISAMGYGLCLIATVALAQSNLPSITVPDGGSRSAQSAGPLPSTATTSAADALMQAMEMNNADTELARIAAAKAQNPRIKLFADMLVRDHTQAMAKLRTVPNSTGSEAKLRAGQEAPDNRLAKLSGAEFDREYIKATVLDHQEALTFLDRQSRTDAATVPGATTLASVAQDLIPIERDHLQQAQMIQIDVEIDGANRH